MISLKENQVKIIFHNQPKLSNYKIQADFNERRLSLVPQIEDFVSNNPRFKGEEVNITFNDKGVGSLVSVLETKSEKFILKIPLSKKKFGGEGLFLNTWKNADIKVPEVIEDGMINEYQYILMEYIDTQLLSQKYSLEEMTKYGIDLKMGKILHAMHQPVAKGYGYVIHGQAEFSKFNDWINSPRIQEAIKYVQENKLLGNEHGSLTLAIKILEDHTNKNNSSFCHNDFGSSNAFATEPITIFDPNPEFNNGYLDLGLSLFNIISSGLSSKQMIDGYFGEEAYNQKALQAAILLNAYIKLPSRHKKELFDQIKNIQKFLIQNKHLLGD